MIFISSSYYGQINYNITACYDRILPNLSHMTSKAYGIPIELVNLNYKMSTKAKYNIIVEGKANKFTYTSPKKRIIFGKVKTSGNSRIS
jgi:hypothetical protein